MFTNFALLDLGAPELIIILAILLLLFGGKKLPELSKSLGESMRELRKGMNGDVNQNQNKNETEKPQQENSSS
jgi:sec-independent protein translocase protein TatA